MTFNSGLTLVIFNNYQDLKPENILLSTSRRGDSVVKLVDFGCAVVNTPMHPSKKVFVTPTPAYCPPELLSKKEPISPPMDMFSLGIILYIMLTGAHPFDLEGNSTDEQVEERILRGPSQGVLIREN